MTIVALSLAVLTLVVYWKVQHYEFLVWDDYEYIVENTHVRSGLTMENILWAFSISEVSYWHPLAWLSHMLDCELYGVNPQGHHLNALLFHLLSSLLLFLVLHELTGALWQSALVAALFSIHPLRIESVAWVTERKDVLGTLFWMLTMLFYVKYARQPTRGRYLLVFIFFTLGLMAKPMLVTLPFVLLLLDYWPLGRIRLGQTCEIGSSKSGTRVPLRLLILEKLPLLFFSAIAGVVTFLAAGELGSVPNTEALPLGFRIGNVLYSYVKYISKTFWPSDLAFFYPFPQDPWPVWQVTGCVLLLGCISFLVIRFRRRPYLVTGWFWYLGTLFPVIGIVQVGGQSMADRFTYLPHVGLFITVVWAAADLTSRFHLRSFVLSLISGLIVLLLAVSTHHQLSYWSDSVSLFSRALEVTERNYTAHYQLGCEFMRQGKIESAIHHFSEALRFRPDHQPAQHNIGIALVRKGRLNEAIEHYASALAYRPEDPAILSSLGDAYLMLGKHDQAIFYYSRVLLKDPSQSKLQNNMGLAYLKMGMMKEAVVHFEEALKINPHDGKARYNIQLTREKIQETRPIDDRR